MASDDKNILGEELEICGLDPVTGFFRNGFCQTGPTDRGVHVVCAIVTDDFLEYSKSQGNDLITPKPQFNFPGLKAGDQWCLCAARWFEAFEAGHAPHVRVEATHERASEIIPLEVLMKYRHTTHDKN